MYFTGNSNINEAETYTEAVAAKVSGIHIIVVSVGSQINRIELNAIASDPDARNIFQVERISELPNLISLIPGALCNGKKFNSQKISNLDSRTVFDKPHRLFFFLRNKNKIFEHGLIRKSRKLG